MSYEPVERTLLEIRQLANLWRARIENEYGFRSGNFLHETIQKMGGKIECIESQFFPTGALVKSSKGWRIITRPYHMYVTDNFYLAFGLGEYAMHEDLPYFFTEFDTKAPYHPATVFAYSLLMPTEEFKEEWNKKGIECAVHFSVEKKTAKYRAISLGLVGDYQI